MVNQDYQQVRIRIAFHPIEERFEVSNPAIEKDKNWFADIAPIVSGELKAHKVGRDYLELNPENDLVKSLRDRVAAAEAPAEDATLTDAAEILYGTAVLAEGGSVAEPAAFAAVLARQLGRSLS